MVLTRAGCCPGHLFQFRFHECDLVLRATENRLDPDDGGKSGHVPIRLSPMTFPCLQQAECSRATRFAHRFPYFASSRRLV